VIFAQKHPNVWTLKTKNIMEVPMLINTIKLFKSKLQATLNSSDQRAKIQDSDFIIGLCQAVAHAKEGFTLAELQRSVCHFLKISIMKSAFNERLSTASLVKHLQIALGAIVSLLVSKRQSKEVCVLSRQLGVSEIIGIDSSMVTLWDGLGKIFKGTFMKASIKLHLAINLVSGSVKWFEMTPGATHDSQRFPELIPGILYVFDLGYWSGALLKKMMDLNIFFYQE
jgi:hypothetical protein